jgi:HEPN domain-containing protein
LAVQALVASGNNVQALFFAHLVIEKLLKAHWVKDTNGNFPPRVHNLEFLLAQTNLLMTAEDIDELRIMNAWNIEGRYQDYRDMIYRTTTQIYTEEKMLIVDKIRTWLLNQLP